MAIKPNINHINICWSLTFFVQKWTLLFNNHHSILFKNRDLYIIIKEYITNKH